MFCIDSRIAKIMQQPESLSHSPSVALCKTGCGFCANPGCDDMCSLCFKKSLKNATEPSSTSAVTSGAATPQAPAQPAAHVPVPGSSDLASERKRCLACKRKLSLATAFTCKCSGCYCAAHRYPEAHECSFDHKGEQRRRLASDNPCIVAAKVLKL